VLETLRLPIDQLEPYLDARLAKLERIALAEVIADRVTGRKPAAYLTKRAYIQGAPFHVDERVIVPRSYIGELLSSDLFGGEDFTLIEGTGSAVLSVQGNGVDTRTPTSLGYPYDVLSLATPFELGYQAPARPAGGPAPGGRRVAGRCGPDDG